MLHPTPRTARIVTARGAGEHQSVRQPDVRTRRELKIVWCEAGAFRDASEHPRADLFGVVEREDNVRPRRAFERSM